MKTTFMMVIRARMGLDCGAAAEPSNLLGKIICLCFNLRDHFDLGNSDHKDVVEATRSCLGSDDEARCLLTKLFNLVNDQVSRGAVCSSLRVVESGLKTSLGIFCHEELEASGANNQLLGASLGSCSFWGVVGCTAAVLSASTVCVVTGPLLPECIAGVLGVSSGCIPCICKILNC
jgi:hypothetical protein